MTTDDGPSNTSYTGSTDDRLELVTLDTLGKLRLSRASYFTPERLAIHIADQTALVWRAIGEQDYVIVGQWRHRVEIGQIYELSYGRNREALLAKALETFRASSTRLVVVGLDDFSAYLAFYAKFGFSRLDEIIELERLGRGELPAAPAVDIQPLRSADLVGALTADVAAFPWLWRNSEEEFTWYAQQEGVEMYVARDARQEIVGYSGLTLRDREGHLDRLAVAATHQGQGFGQALLYHACERMLDAGARRLALSTQSGNKVSQRLYHWFGFHPTFRAQKIYGLWLDGSNEVVV